jgi:glycyl-tRNA synthetase beta chain
MIRRDFLLEIRTEEIPAAALAGARLDLETLVTEGLKEEGLAAESAESLATPRRLILILRGLPQRQEDRLSEVVGPPAAVAFDADGKLTRAGEGFARAQKVEPSELVIVETARGKTVAARRKIAGRPAAEVLAEVVPRAVAALTFPKTMRWGAGDRVFVQPVRGLLALFGSEVVPMEVLGIAAGGSTRGHRLLSDEELAVGGVDDYLAKLRAHDVEPDGEARRLGILEAARRLASEVGGSVEADADLAATLADLVECPAVIRGSFDAKDLSLPEDVTTTAMRTHQKYLPVRGPGGLMPYFVAVMDNREDRQGLIARGNEWVLNARLADARFFYEEDIRESLESRLPQLARLSFHDRLGDYRARTARLEELAGAIAHALNLPESRPGGSNGRAPFQGRPDDPMVRSSPICRGRRRHLRAPEGSRTRSGRRSTTSTARARRRRSAARGVGGDRVARDRFDALAGFFAIGPRADRLPDPYGLRRAGLGAVDRHRAGWRLTWRPVLREALRTIRAQSDGRAGGAARRPRKFFAERLRNFLERRGHAYDEISAVLAVDVWNFADVSDRALALSEARRQTDFRSLILAFKRIRNILGDERPGAPSPDLYREEAERRLAAEFLEARPVIARLGESRRYREALENCSDRAGARSASSSRSP